MRPKPVEPPRPLWIPVRRLLLHNQFLKHRQARKQDLTVDVAPPIPIFISHRWHSLRNPDPEGYQHHVTVRFLIEAICLSRRLCERFFTVGSHPVVSQQLRNALERHHDLHGTDGWQNRIDAGPPTALLLKAWIAANFPPLHLEAAELAEIAHCLEQVGVWYDYSCMPQQPFNSNEERDDFTSQLSGLSNLIAHSHVLLTWDAGCLSRAWCLYEALVAHHEDEVNIDITPNHPTKLHLEFDDQRAATCHGSRALADNLDGRLTMISGLDADALETTFRNNDIRTSRNEDLTIVAALLSSYMCGEKTRLPRL